ncbi:MAG: class II aldolase/adducin family protein [Pseudomonadota bacterium]
MTAMHPDEWQLRCDLAACYRLFVHFGWTDLIFTHLSARVPHSADEYLINPYGLLFEEITASTLIKVRFDGTVVAGDYPVNTAGHHIHSAILQARPDINVALHSHTRAGIAVSCMPQGLLPLSQQAMEVIQFVCYHDYAYSVDDPDYECRKLAEDIGTDWLMVMRNHGLLAAGRTVAEAFYYLYTLENACKVQVDVLAATDTPVLPAPDAVDAVARSTAMPADGPAPFVQDSWRAVLRRLQDSGSNWAT